MKLKNNMSRCFGLITSTKIDEFHPPIMVKPDETIEVPDDIWAIRKDSLKVMLKKGEIEVVEEAVTKKLSELLK